MGQLPNPRQRQLKAEHAPRLDRATFDAKVLKLWPQASKLPLSPVNLDAMYAVHQALGLSPVALCAGFAEAMHSGKMR